MPNCFINRELSWLEFNRRVLMNASNPLVPLCERLNFFSIFQSNLDEFFMVRIGSLHDQKLLDDGSRENKTGMRPSSQIEAALAKIRSICRERDEVYNVLMDDLASRGIRTVRFSDISSEAEEQLGKLFHSDVLPYLSRFMITRKEDFPFLKNREIYAIAVLKSRDGSVRVAVIPCAGTVLPRLIQVPGEEGRFILLEEFILHYVPALFPEEKVIGKSLARITRNADIDADAVYDEDLNYRDHMAEIIRMRKRLCPVRMELSRQIDTAIVDRLREYMGLSASQVFEYDTPLELSFLYRFSDMLRGKAELFYPPRTSRKLAVPDDADPSMIGMIKRGDVLIHYPYDSFNTFLRLLREAAANPRVTAIRMTLYRVARNSKVAEVLEEAAENGKRVEVFVELKARFDEENNIEWSRRLESAGCRVIYGIEHIKVHSKLCLISLRNDDGGEEYITQIGTGNYNENTSRIYTDLCLMTYNQQIGRDGRMVFDALAKGETIRHAATLLVSPNDMQIPLMKLIDEQIRKGRNGKIRLKLNSLTDKELMDKLIEASQAGVSIRMVIRGISCLLPGVPGMTDNIQIISIVGRYLEHSRIYLFGEGNETKAFISSADWMTRNMSRRVEIACPVLHRPHIEMLGRIMETCLNDTEQSWELDSTGAYRKRNDPEKPYCDAQDAFHDPSFSPCLP